MNMACSAVDRAGHSPGLGYLPQPTARQGRTKRANRRVRIEAAATPGWTVRQGFALELVVPAAVVFVRAMFRSVCVDGRQLVARV